MTQPNETQNVPKPGPIKLETVYPIMIREKDGALSFAKKGETIRYETNLAIQNAMLAHKFNELATQTNRLQAVAFANNRILSEILSKRGVDNGNEEHKQDAGAAKPKQ